MRTPPVWGSVSAMRVLIVGCGYVGAALGAALVQSGHQVFGLRRRPEADAALTQMGLVPCHADFTREEELRRLPGPFDWVVNTAAPSEGDAAGYRRVYLEGTATLLRWLKDRPPQRYVYTSSTGVYGQNDGSVVTEESPTEPESETARVLVETERLLLAAAGERTPSNPVPGLDTQNPCFPLSPALSPRVVEGEGEDQAGTGKLTADFPAVILRVAGIYGPDRGYWFKQFRSGEARIEGQGERVLNLVHRDDVVGAIQAALERGRPGLVCNVVDDEPVRQVDFFRGLAELTGLPMPPAAPEGGSAGAWRGSLQKRVSNRRLKSELGYQLRYPTFREGGAAFFCKQNLRRGR